MIYEAWGYKEFKVAELLTTPTNIHKGLITKNMVLKRQFDVDGFVEAMILHHEANGWEPYNPMEPDRKEYLVALKKLGKNPKEVNDERQKHGLPRLEWLDKEVET